MAIWESISQGESQGCNLGFSLGGSKTPTKCLTGEKSTREKKNILNIKMFQQAGSYYKWQYGKSFPRERVRDVTWVLVQVGQKLPLKFLTGTRKVYIPIPNVKLLLARVQKRYEIFRQKKYLRKKQVPKMKRDIRILKVKGIHVRV